MEKIKITELKKQAAKVRLNALDAVFAAQSGHIGGSLSSADILTYLYFDKMNIDPANAKNPDRDRLVLSKGHCTPALYSVLAERGYFPVEDLKKFRQADSVLQGHPDMKYIPGVDMSTGSLGTGVSAAAGMALAGKLDSKSYKVYAIVGDGESQEGQVWECAMFAAHHKLDNFRIILDKNNLHISGNVHDVMNPDPLDKKFEAFGWNVISCDGHDFESIEKAFDLADKCEGKPSVIIADTVKGKGVSFMENNASWHGSAPKAEQYEIAVAEVKAVLESL